MTHFRYLSALILREFVAQALGKCVCEVEAADIICWYSNTLRRANTHHGTRDTTNCIIRILTGHNPKIQDVGDLVYKWLLRVTPLTSVSYFVYFCEYFSIMWTIPTQFIFRYCSVEEL